MCNFWRRLYFGIILVFYILCALLNNCSTHACGTWDGYTQLGAVCLMVYVSLYIQCERSRNKCYSLEIHLLYSYCDLL